MSFHSINFNCYYILLNDFHDALMTCLRWQEKLCPPQCYLKMALSKTTWLILRPLPLKTMLSSARRLPKQ